MEATATDKPVCHQTDCKMAPLILSLALLLLAEIITCKSAISEIEQERITQDELLKRLGLLETNMQEQNSLQNQLSDQARSMQSKLDFLEVEKANLIQSVATLEKKIAELEQKSDFLQDKSSKERTQAEGRGSYVARSCQDLKSVDPSLPSGSYLIDPDGGGVGDAAIYVFCDMNGAGKTFVRHDSEATISVSSCSDPGCYSKKVTYNATAKQIAALIDISATCKQFLKYECLATPLESNGIRYSFWSDRNGNPQYFWAGNQPNPSNVHRCQCGMDGNCVHNSYKCNCDAMAPTLQNDSGYITDMNLLPVTKLNFGHTQFIGASGKHTLGRMECSGRAIVNEKPTSCQELFRLGHTLKGFYQVKGIVVNSNKIETIYCDFEQEPSSPNFERRLGFVDVKTSPVHFYVQRYTEYPRTGTIIPWEITRLNVGNAMNTATGVFTAPRDGVYHFFYSGIKNTKATGMFVFLRMNGDVIGTAFASFTDAYETASLQATLRLKQNDQIDLWLHSGEIRDDGNHYQHFTGWLDEEELQQL